MNRPAKPLGAQLNLLLLHAREAVVPDNQQKELTLALVELLIGAAQQSSRHAANGGGDEPEADR